MKRYTKWIPLGNYCFADNDFIVFVKKNKRTGLMKFKTKRVCGRSIVDTFTNLILPSGLIDVQKAWDEINNME